MAELVGEHAAKSDPEGTSVDARRFLPIPASRDGARDMLRPNRHAAPVEVGSSEPVVVKVAAASADDGPLGTRVKNDRRERGKRRLACGRPPIEPDSARLEQTIRFGESAGEGALGKRNTFIERNFDGERHRQDERQHERIRPDAP